MCAIKRYTSRLANLTEEKIRVKTKNGNTPLHMAAKNGRIGEIPSCLLSIELFLEKNNQGQTPLHLAAWHKHLDKIPREFLTKESLTVFDAGGRTPLHNASSGCLEQIPKEFLTTEFLKLREKNYQAWTVFHHVACANDVKKIPPENITSELWKLRDGSGSTPQDCLSISYSFTYHRVRNIPMIKSKCHQCFGGIEFSENGMGHRVICPYCGQKTKLGDNPFASALRTKAKIRILKCDPAPSKVPPPVNRKRTPIISLSKLTEETIRISTKSGNTPLHRAAKNGRIHQIPRHLLQVELFTAKNNFGETPIHVAAKHGCLDQIPRQFLTGETITIKIGDGAYTTGSGYLASTETALHVAVRCGYAEQIPKEFLTPEFLSIEATGYRLTLLHDLAYANKLDLVPEIYANSEMWNLKDYIGRTPREIVEEKIRHEIFIAKVRNEPATEKQKEKLRWFGCVWDEGITKGQSSDALDECVRQFPERNADYYSRPATEEQKAQLRLFRKNPDDNRRDGPLTYGEANDLIRDCEREAQRRYIEPIR